MSAPECVAAGEELQIREPLLFSLKFFATQVCFVAFPETVRPLPIALSQV